MNSLTHSEAEHKGPNTGHYLSMRATMKATLEHLFKYLKNWLQSQHFNNNNLLMEGVKMWLVL
jgi:hypothetical protein